MRNLLAPLLAATLAWAPATAGDSDPAPVRELAGWTARAEGSRRGLEAEREAQLREILARTRTLAAGSFEGQRAVTLALLDLYGSGLRLGDSLDAERIAGGVRMRELAARELRRWLDPPTVRWLTKEVLINPGQHPPTRRAACALTLAGERGDELLMALSICVREGAGPVREAALWALAGWDAEAVNGTFVRLLENEDLAEPSAALPALESHFGKVRLAAEDPLTTRLLVYVSRRIVDENWRTAVHATGIASALDTSVVAPVLIRALEAWIVRAGAGEPVRRVQHDLIHSLELRSGLSLGAHPGRWTTWFKGYRAGQRPLQETDRSVPRTEASFFGIRPLTDRVVFLIDHSGSMAGPMAASQHSSAEDWTRYKEAVARMIAVLEVLGPRTRFNVLTFDDSPASWHSGLRPATTSNLRAARSWLLSRRPKGGTLLRRGVAEALGVDRGGYVDLDDIEADTLIVLCDGQTAEGSGWVRPFLERVQVRTRWLIHTVQLGTFGDSTLELLADLTGGDHVKI